MSEKARSKTLFHHLLSAMGGATVTGIFALQTQCENSALERQKIALQQQQIQLVKQRDTSNAAAEEAKLSLQRELQQTRNTEQINAKVDDRIFAHKMKVFELKQSIGDEYWTLQFRNDCFREVTIAVSYQALDEEWVVTGWWQIKPGITAPLADTRNNTIYYYAEADGFVWHGDANDADSDQEEINDTRFYRLSDDHFPGIPSRTVLFRRFDFHSKDWSDDPVIPLTCKAR